MILYLIKSGLCLAILLGIYVLFLEREKMHRFNRYFLLFSLVFGLTVPFITLEQTITIPVKQLNEQVYEFVVTDYTASSFSDSAEASGSNPLSLSFLWWFAYISITGFLIIRFMSNISKLIKAIKRNRSISKDKTSFILVEDEIVPHSFFTALFVNKKKFEKGAIHANVIAHELVHIKQFHSLDILFVEILRIVFWFNPVFYFYKKAIQLNHEFIADEEVLKSSNPVLYKKLVLSYLNQDSSSMMTSSFNLSLTKKRLQMMTTKHNKLRVWPRKLMIAPLLIALVFAFSEKTSAQDIKEASISELVDQLNTKLDDGKSLTKSDSEKLRSLIRKLQKQKGLMPPPPPKEMTLPPPPPKAMTLPPPPPPRVKKVVPKDNSIKNYQIAVKRYMDLNPKNVSKKELESSYNKVRSAYRVIVKKSKKTDGSKMPPPPPPLPPTPENRIKSGN